MSESHFVCPSNGHGGHGGLGGHGGHGGLGGHGQHGGLVRLEKNVDRKKF